MPDCFVRYSVADGTIHEAAFLELVASEAGEAVASVGARAQVPDARTERYDRAQRAIRAATAQETAAYDLARRTADEQSRWDSDLLVMALARWTAQKVGVAPATARSEILAIYRSLRG